MVWGSNINWAAGISTDDKDQIDDPRAVPLPAPILLERVRMLACATRHSLLLTFMNNIYACGDNTEGALGMGDLKPRCTARNASILLGTNIVKWWRVGSAWVRIRWTGAIEQTIIFTIFWIHSKLTNAICLLVSHCYFSKALLLIVGVAGPTE